jgi:hypothetical protein
MAGLAAWQIVAHARSKTPRRRVVYVRRAATIGFGMAFVIPALAVPLIVASAALALVSLVMLRRAPDQLTP